MGRGQNNGRPFFEGSTYVGGRTAQTTITKNGTHGFQKRTGGEMALIFNAIAGVAITENGTLRHRAEK
jgi:hypothetical protein